MAHLRHPIIGDTTHGDGKQNRFFREHFGLNRLWLLAQSLSFTHPTTGEPVTIVTEPEAEWLQVFEGLGWDETQLESDSSLLLA